MKWSEIAAQECSIARTLSVVGDTWTMLVIRELFNGNGRFNGLLDATQAPPAILSERLAGLERDDIVVKRPYSSRRDRFEYRLTAKGKDLYPVLISLMTWGDRWMTDGTPPVQLAHRTCGHHVTPVLACPHCGDHIDPRDMQRHAEGEPTVTVESRSPRRRASGRPVDDARRVAGAVDARVPSVPSHVPGRSGAAPSR